MESPAGAATFQIAAEAYDCFMGRYSPALATALMQAAGVTPGQRALDVGCGPGALTRALADALGADHVASLDPPRRAALRDELRRRLGAPAGAFMLSARAWCASGRAPG